VPAKVGYSCIKPNIHVHPSPMLLLIKICMMIRMQNSLFKKYYLALLLVISAVVLTSCDHKKHESNKSSPSNNLKIAIIRHGEKPKDGDNLSC